MAADVDLVDDFNTPPGTPSLVDDFNSPPPRAPAVPEELRLGDMYFRDNLTKDEMGRDKQLGYCKHFLAKHHSCNNKVVRIIWPKKMVVVKGKEEGSVEKEVAWYDESGTWRTSSTAKSVEKEVEEAMAKWWSRVDPEPGTESE